MSTNAVAFLLLNKFRNGATISNLCTALDELRADILRAQKDLGFSGDSLDVIHYAVSFFLIFQYSHQLIINIVL